MAEIFKAKVFRSGNSLALRLPKGIGFAHGDDVQIVGHANGSFSFWRADEAKAVFMASYGSMSKGFMRDGRIDAVQPERDWGAGASDAEAA